MFQGPRAPNARIGGLGRKPAPGTENVVALCKCPDCDGQVSSSALKCPHCGCKLKVVPFLIFAAVSLLIVVLTVYLQDVSR